jgi:hypothetical protein
VSVIPKAKENILCVRAWALAPHCLRDDYGTAFARAVLLCSYQLPKLTKKGLYKLAPFNYVFLSLLDTLTEALLKTAPATPHVLLPDLCF